MYFRNKLNTGLIIISIFFLTISLPTYISGQAFEQTTSKGLRINLVKDSSMMFNHAEIVVYYSEIKDPTVPYLTLMSIFDKQINNPQTGLLNTLFKIGNDFNIEYKIDHFIVRINFLPADTNLFISFLKGLYSYRGFSLKKFNYTVKHFWKLFKRNDEWKKIISAQIAFSKLFNKDHPGQFLITNRDPGRLNLSHIRSFYKNNYTLPNSYITIRGDIKPYFVFGLVEKAFRNFRNLKANYRKFRYDKNNPERKVVIVDDGTIGTPNIYWIDPISPVGNIDHHHSGIVNNLLFGYPLGRIPRNASAAGIKNFNVSSRIHHHRNISIICRRIRIGYRDIEKFIFIADNNINKLGVGRISRKEYLDNYNFIFHKRKIDSDDYSEKASELIAHSFKDSGNILTGSSQEKLLKDLSYVNFTRILSDPSGNYIGSRNRKRGIIVIFGKADIIKRYFRNIKPEVITIR
ncbi:MAG: insulinase family protein [Acidobacteriota bacterium]